MNKKISIILCSYNEVNHIGECIRLISKTLENVEIIIVDDNSNDGTLEKLDKLKSIFNFKLFVRKNERGLASAQKKGFSKATGDYVCTMDVNSREQILHFVNLTAKLEGGYDVAFLSRYISGGGDQRIFLRAFASNAINLASRILLRIPFHDFTSGIFLMKRELFDHLEIKISGYAEWFIEFVYVVHKKNIKL